jgi:hypothetical protein
MRTVGLLFLALLATPPATPPPRAAEGDAGALDLAAQVERALGGPALARAGSLAFTFAVVADGRESAAFRHAWDRRTDRYAVEGPGEHGRTRVVFDLRSRDGRAWVDGAPQEGERLRAALDWAYRRFINDTYWLLVPFKLRDPGVRLALQGERREGGRTFDLLGLSFDRVGLTPGDRYTLWVDRATRRIDRWEMLLEGREPPPSVAAWEGWVQVGGVWFSTRRTLGSRAIELRDIAVGASAPAGAFDAPAAPGSR